MAPARALQENSSADTRREREGLAPFVVVLIVLAVTVYGRSLSSGFVDWDDSELILGNPMLRPGGSLGPALLHPYAGLYAPLTYALYAAIAAVSRAASTPLNPAYFHAASIALHAAGSVLLMLWLRRLCGRTLPAAIGAAVWLVHPLQAEPVAWASGLNAVMGGTLGIAALLLAGEGVVRDGSRRWAYLIASVACAAASLAAKPSGILLPVMLLAVHRLLLQRPWKETLSICAAWAVVLIPFALVGRTAQAAGMVEAAPPLLQRFLVAGHAVGFYLIKALWPSHLAIDYGLTPSAVLAGRWAVPCAVADAVVLVALLQMRHRPWLAAGVAVFVAGIGPVLGFVPFYFQSYSTVADRYAYLSLVGVAIIVAFVVRDLRWWMPRRARFIAALSAAGIAACSVVTFAQVGVWHDTSTLMTQAYAVNPDSIAANGQLGIMAQRGGDLGFAEGAFRKVLDRRPYDGAIRAQYAGVLLQTGRATQAVPEFLRVVNEQPDNARAFNGLGLALAATGHNADALRAFARAIQLDPTLADAAANAGDALSRLGDLDHARAAYAAALRIDPHQSKAIAGLRQLATSH